MALSPDRIAFGIHSMIPRRRTSANVDGLPYGILKVIGGGTLSLSAEFEDLFAGSNKFAWASEPKTIDSSFSSTVKAMPDFLFELFLGADVATTAASASAAASAVTNANGTSLVDATTGITSVITVDTDADVKAGKYLIVAASATTVQVYAISSDIDFSVGTDQEFETDDLTLLAAAATITSGAPTVIGNLGISVNGGSGAIGMTAGDSAIFTLDKAHGGISEITIGKTGTTFPEHAMTMLGAKRSDSSLFEIEVFKAVGAGFDIPMAETVFTILEITQKLLYDTTVNAVAKIRATAGE